MPFACIIFMLIGTPIGVMSKKGGIAQGAVTSILFFLIYYFESSETLRLQDSSQVVLVSSPEGVIRGIN